MKNFYNRYGQNMEFNLDNKNLIGSGVFGNVYKIDSYKCLKVFKSFDDNNSDTVVNYSNDFYKECLTALVFIRKYDLKNFYKIYEFIFTKKRQFAGYIMKYYQSKSIDILTMPTEYTLDNIINIYNSILKLALHNIHITDMSINNILLDDNEITVIDADLFRYNINNDYDDLLKDNVNRLRFLIRDLYTFSITKYHNNILTPIEVYDIFSKINHVKWIDSFCNELKCYKYPIDYIKKLSKTR